MTDLHAQVKPLLPGLAISAVVAVAAMFLAEHYGAPVMLFALLLGMALNFLTQEEGGQKNRSAAGIDFTAKAVLRLGVALLGLRITADQVMALGWQPIAMVVLAISSAAPSTLWRRWWARATASRTRRAMRPRWSSSCGWPCCCR